MEAKVTKVVTITLTLEENEAMALVSLLNIASTRSAGDAYAFATELITEIESCLE